MNDAENLRQFVESRSQAAFEALVRGRIDLVHSTALRLLNGDAHRAADVTQEVFIDLARKAAVLSRHSCLVGWLYQSTRFAAAKIKRSEQRRAVREQEAQTMQEVSDRMTVAEASWCELRPVLDEVMGELAERDRHAVLMRFFDRSAFSDIGRELGVSENAAQKRVERALDALRVALGRRGVSSTMAALGAVLTTHTVTGAPVGLAAHVAEAAVAGAPVGFGLSATQTLRHFMNVKSAGVVAAVAVMVAGLSWVAYDGFVAETETVPPTQSVKVAGAMAEPARKTMPASLSVGATPSRVTSVQGAPSSGEDFVPEPGQSIYMIPAKEWKNAGRGTARDALMSQYWAMAHGDIEWLAASFSIPDSSRSALTELVLSLPSSLRARCNSPEQFAALLLSAEKPPKGFLVFKSRTNDDGTQALSVGTLLPGQDKFAGGLQDFHRDADGQWRRVASDQLIGQWRALLRMDALYQGGLLADRR